ncbi:hypothetical protein [Oerskovia flava]|uniref:hypothetical protein n=1 Tax=Oerskovia flava TaxID=2986422 RepID=UPI00223ED83A|nr:hypothetical protein [Oerskovia sp. JB1-3-2]
MSGTEEGLVTVGVWVVALLVSVLGGLLVTPGVLRLAARESEPTDPPMTNAAGAPMPPVPPPPVGGPMGTAAVKALRGGTWIGVLERLAITLCLLAGYPAGIAFVVAIKGLGRYPELREHPVASERFVIGTLSSMVWAAGVGMGGAALLAVLR